MWAESALADLEGIDDDLDDHKIIFVKMSDVREGRYSKRDCKPHLIEVTSYSQQYLLNLRQYPLNLRQYPLNLRQNPLNLGQYSLQCIKS